MRTDFEPFSEPIRNRLVKALKRHEVASRTTTHPDILNTAEAILIDELYEVSQVLSESQGRAVGAAMESTAFMVSEYGVPSEKALAWLLEQLENNVFEGKKPMVIE